MSSKQSVVDENAFLSLSLDDFMALSRKWIDKNFNIELPRLNSYDDALNFFKTLPPDLLTKLSEIGRLTLPTEHYATIELWLEIVAKPSKITKIHQSGLTRHGNEKSITEIAQTNDKLAMLYAIRNKLAERMDGGDPDVARLSRELSDVVDQIANEERKIGPKDGTPLSQLLNDYKADIGKRQRSGNGRRNSFKSKIKTIDDAEN